MSNIPTRPQPNLDEIIERAHAELKKAESTPFSEHALEEFRKHAGAYAVELINESVKGAKRHQAEGVSSSDVRHASQYLVSSTRHRIYRHAGMLGVIPTFALTLIGTSLITVHMIKD